MKYTPPRWSVSTVEKAIADKAKGKTAMSITEFNEIAPGARWAIERGKSKFKAPDGTPLRKYSEVARSLGYRCRSNNSIADVKAIILQYPIYFTDLAQRLGVVVPTVRVHARKLEEAGEIKRVYLAAGFSRNRRYGWRGIAYEPSQTINLAQLILGDMEFYYNEEKHCINCKGTLPDETLEIIQAKIGFAGLTANQCSLATK